MQYESDANGNSYAWCSGSVFTSGGPTDSILVVKNTSNSSNLHIDKILVSSSTIESFNIRVATIDSPTGTSVRPVNLNTQSVNVVDVVSVHTETTNNESGDLLATLFVGANAPFVFKTDGLFLGKNRVVTVTSNTSAVASVTIMGHYKNPNI